MGLWCCCSRRPLVLQFSFSEVYFHLPNTMKDIWAEFADIRRGCFVVIRHGFQTFEDKSSAINADTGVNTQLAAMIYKRYLPGMKLAVGKPEYKTIIESKLGITCVHNEIVMEVMWGIQHLMRHLVPEEKEEVAKDDCFPMSQGLKMFLSRYGFDVEPEMVNEQIVATARALFDCDVVYKNHLKYLATASLCFKNLSGINCEHWGALKLATALKVISCPEEEDFHEVLSEDELLKLKEEAPKYKDIVSKVHCLRTYENISSAHQVRAEKRRLLGSLVKEAKEACEKGKLHSESEQIPQEHVMFANLCRMILPLITASKLPYAKRSWDSAFEPIESTFCEGLSLGETSGTRIEERFSFSGAQPSTSKAIVPYKPVPHVLLSILVESQIPNIGVDNMDIDQYINRGKSILALLTTKEQVEVGIEATPLASVGDSKDEAKLLAEHSEQNEANNIEKLMQVQANGGSGLPPRPPKSVVSLPVTPPVSNPSTPFDGKVLRRSPRLKRDSSYEHVQFEDTPRKRHKKIPACSLSQDN